MAGSSDFKNSEIFLTLAQTWQAPITANYKANLTFKIEIGEMFFTSNQLKFIYAMHLILIVTGTAGNCINIIVFGTKKDAKHFHISFSSLLVHFRHVRASNVF